VSGTKNNDNDHDSAAVSSPPDAAAEAYAHPLVDKQVVAVALEAVLVVDDHRLHGLERVQHHKIPAATRASSSNNNEDDDDAHRT
jgi:hypothetical protein